MTGTKNSSSNKRLLILANTILFPARRNGVSVRYYPFVNELIHRGYIIDLIIINKYHEQYTEDDLQQAHKIYKTINVIDAKKIISNSLSHLVNKIINTLHLLSPLGIPYCLIDNNKKHYLSELTTILKSRAVYDYSIGVEVGGGNAMLLNELPAEASPRNIVCDFIDSAYLLRARSPRTIYARINPVTRLEDIKTKRWEHNISNTLPCIYISKKDAATTNGNATVIPNCVVDDDYNRAMPVKLKSPNIGFVGNMGYAPNIEACDFLCDKIFPALLIKIPNLHLYIIGRDPSGTLGNKYCHSKIHVTGEVDDIWRYIKSIETFVFPMKSGAGLQNKVLEAMHAEKPVVCSKIANEGIEAMHDRELYIASTIEEYVKYTEKSLSKNNTNGAHAKSFVQKHFSLKKGTHLFEKVIFASSSNHR